MKLELKENMYVRTKDGRMGKLMGCSATDKNKIAIWTNTTEEGIKITPVIDKDTIAKASYNIIDILECGDIIKLFMEDDIDEEDTNIFELIAINYNDNEIGVFNSDFQIEFFPIENLRGVLTHEQMEQMVYKVEE